MSGTKITAHSRAAVATMRAGQTRARAWTAGAAGCIAACIVLACGPEDPPPAGEVTWREDVAPLFAAACGDCHGEDDRAAGYSVATYLEAIGYEAGGARMAVAGDPESALLRILEDAAHQTALQGGVEEIGGDAGMVHRWVVDSALAYFRSDDHPGGILYPGGTAFHGRQVADAGWSMADCRTCHGADYAGGSGPTCLSCHPATPEACGTCHSAPGDPPPFRGLGGVTDPEDASVGAHEVHVHGGAVSAGMSCGTCHPGRSAIDDDSHREGTVHLRFMGVARAGGLEPAWDIVDRTCAGTWCHGSGLSDGAEESPPWDAPGSATCGTCHQVPPENLSSGGPHPEVDSCGSCHGAVIDDAGNWVDVRRHVDGVIDRGWP